MLAIDDGLLSKGVIGNDFIIGSHGSDTSQGNRRNDTIYGGFWHRTHTRVMLRRSRVRQNPQVPTMQKI